MTQPLRYWWGTQPGKISGPLAMPENDNIIMPVAGLPLKPPLLFSPRDVPGVTVSTWHAPSHFILRAPYEVTLVSRLLNEETEAQLCPSGSGSHSEKGRAVSRTSGSLLSLPPSSLFGQGRTKRPTEGSPLACPASPAAWMQPLAVRGAPVGIPFSEAGTLREVRAAGPELPDKGSEWGLQTSKAGLLILLRDHSQGSWDGARPPRGSRELYPKLKNWGGGGVVSLHTPAGSSAPQSAA